MCPVHLTRLNSFKFFTFNLEDFTKPEYFFLLFVCKFYFTGARISIHTRIEKPGRFFFMLPNWSGNLFSAGEGVNRKF